MKRRGRRFRIEHLEARQMLAASDLIISEFMATNDDSLRDEDGDTSDWLELYNNSEDSVSLQGLLLADDVDQWSLPAMTLEPFEFLLVFASGKDRVGSELHANFKLSSEGEPLRLLTADGDVIHEYATYPFQEENKSYGVAMSSGAERTLLASGADATYLVPTNNSLGLSWTEIGFNDASWQQGSTGIGYERSGSNFAPLLASRVPNGTRGFYSRIEFGTSDLSALNALTLKMKYDDGFIAYLNGTRVADGNGVRNPQFDSLASGENADGDAERFENFDISLFSDLLRPTGNVLAVHSLNRSTDSSDMLMMPELAYSLPGSVDTSEVGFFNAPSPRGSNGEPIPGFTAPVTIDLPHGFYEETQQVTVSSPDDAAVVRYTTDGSPPTATTGSLYTGPITINRTTVLRAAAFKEDFVPSSVATVTYLFADDVASQTRSTTLDAGFPSSWNGTSPDYGIDPDVVGANDDFGGKYADAFVDSLQSIPTLSIVIGADEMFGSNGIYSNPQNSNLEKAASLEWINPDGSEGFQIDAGLKIQGGAFRSFGLTKKKSFRFKFQKQYGPAKLDYAVFDDSAVTSFDTLTLRMEANDGWQWSNGDNTNRLYARDEWGRRTQLAMGQPAPHGTHTHVYINGVYWGTYNLVERPDEGFASDYIGGDKEDWDIQNSGRAINGDLDSWQEMLSLARDVGNAANGSRSQITAWQKLQGLNPDGSNNPDFEDFLDVENYIDYMIVNMYGGNSDWPHKNYYAGRQRGPDSTGFKFFMWDSEWSLNLRSSVTTNRTNISGNIAEPYAILKDVPEFQLWFADRVQKHFSPGGALYVDPDNPEWDPEHPERNVPASIFAEITDIVREPLIAESARWGDQHNSRPYTVDESWEPQVENLLEDYFPERSENVLSHFRRAGFTADIEAPVVAENDGSVSLGAEEGAIYYTLDGTDPRTVGGGIASSAIQYLAPIDLTGDLNLKVRARSGSTWSALSETTLLASAVPASADNLAITELHFNPSDPASTELDVDNDNYEFIEFTNVGTETIDLSGVQLVQTVVDDDTQGIRFNFAEQTLRPGESLLVVENVPAFRSRYGDSIRVADGVDLPNDPVGQYGGKLSNGGEQITLLASNGQTIRQFSYDDEWHPSTDGEGPSLELLDASLNSVQVDTAQAWKASDSVHGSPGRTSLLTSVEGDLNQDQVVNRSDVDLLYAALDSNSAEASFDLNSDGNVDSSDVQHLIEDIIGAAPGDANLDGAVNFTDFLILSANFARQQESLKWLDADFDGDKEITFADFLLLSANFGT